MLNAQSNTGLSTYEKEWAEIDSLSKRQLYKSLLPKVEEIYQSALQELYRSPGRKRGSGKRYWRAGRRGGISDCRRGRQHIHLL